MGRARRLELCCIAVLAACSREPQPRPDSASAPPPSAPDIAATASQAPPSTPPPRNLRQHKPVASCAPRGSAVEIAIDPRIEIGWAGGVTWLFGYAEGDAVLMHLDASGSLARTRVPLHNAQAAAVDGDRIWLYAPTEGANVPTRWTAVDVSHPDAPKLGAVEPVTVGAKLDWAEALAVAVDRALVVTGVPDDRQLVVIDAKRRAALRAPIALEKGFKPVHVWCHHDRCAAVAIANEGGGPDRRLVVLRVAPDGAVEREQLAPGWIGKVHWADAGDAMIIAWTEDQGLRLSWLDLWGRPLGSQIDARWDAARWVQNEGLFVGPAGPVLAVGERGRWSLATLGPGKAIGAFREVPGADCYFLAAAPLDDGLAWTSFSSSVDYAPIGTSGAMTHSWSADVVSGFLPTSGGAADRKELAKTAGPGRGGLETYVLARLGAASALVVPRGDAARFQPKARVVPLRSLCSAR